VVGDVEPQAVLTLAKEHFGPLKRRDIPPPKPRPEVPQYGSKRVSFSTENARIPYLVMAYKAPVLNDVAVGQVQEGEL